MKYCGELEDREEKIICYRICVKKLEVVGN